LTKKATSKPFGISNGKLQISNKKQERSQRQEEGERLEAEGESGIKDVMVPNSP